MSPSATARIHFAAACAELDRRGISYTEYRDAAQLRIEEPAGFPIGLGWMESGWHASVRPESVSDKKDPIGALRAILQYVKDTNPILASHVSDELLLRLQLQSPVLEWLCEDPVTSESVLFCQERDAGDEPPVGAGWSVAAALWKPGDGLMVIWHRRVLRPMSLIQIKERLP